MARNNNKKNPDGQKGSKEKSGNMDVSHRKLIALAARYGGADTADAEYLRQFAGMKVAPP